jgi:hypothetical protein
VNTLQGCWPLHPQPYSGETLERYVRRLAECYGLRYETFCLHALGIPSADSEARWFKKPTQELLRRLSDGTTVPVEQLEQMTLQRVWDRLVEEMHQYTETDEGRAELERISKQWLSQKS